MQFADLALSEPILRALIAEDYTVATPIQAKAIPHILAGRDVLGSAQTGTGKTAAFALPILQKFSTDRGTLKRVRALVLCPTRELAQQIADGFSAYGRNVLAKHVVIYGGVNQRPQVDAVRRGVETIIATPGRLLDLINQGHVRLDGVETLVLDEADRMLDMGFIHDIKRIAALLPKQRQTLMFSATMPPEIRALASQLQRDPVRVEVTPAAQTADNIEQAVYYVEKKNKHTLLAHLYHELPMARTIVFTRTKHGADKVVRQLHVSGIRAEAIHGNKSQNARQRALANFKSSKTPMLIATDIAARGIDVDGITHVVNYDVTHEPETYVHRIGRTARAGASGAALSFVDNEEKSNLRAIERLLKKQLVVRNDHPEYANHPAVTSSAGSRDADLASSHPRHERSGRPRGEPPRTARGGRDGHNAADGRPQRTAGPTDGRPAGPNGGGRKGHPVAGRGVRSDSAAPTKRKSGRGQGGRASAKRR